jgi:AcrR family transcriptional regulator
MNRRSVYKAPRAEVLKTALDLFSSKGYSATKMSDIAGKVGISVGALYLRFKSKEALCLELIKDQRKEFDRLTDNLPYQDPQKALKAYIALNLEFAMKKTKMLSMFMREHKLPFIKPVRKNFLDAQKKIIRDILSAGVKNGIFRKVNSEDTAYIVFACIRGTILLKHVFGIGTVKNLTNSLYDLITNGIRKDIK